jgi:hypothetical protein
LLPEFGRTGSARAGRWGSRGISAQRVGHVRATDRTEPRRLIAMFSQSRPAQATGRSETTTDGDARPAKRTRRDAWWAVAVGVAAALLVLGHLLIPTPIGTTDTGDGLRLLCQIQAGDPHFYQAHSSADRFVAITYEPIPPNPVACGAYRVTQRYPSSALLVLIAAQKLTHLAGLHGALDMRMTGLIYSLIFGFMIGLFVLVLPGPRWARVGTAVALGILGADATFAPYFISPFSEPMEFVALLGTYAGLLALWRRKVAPVWLLAGVAVIFAMLVTAKSQDIPLALLLALALMTVRCPLGRWAGRVKGRALPAVAAAALIVVAGVNLYLQPQLYNQQLLYTDVFYTILKDSPDVPADLHALDLPPALSKYAGRTYFETRTETADDPNYQIFLQRTTFTGIASFYLHHPSRLLNVTETGIRDVVKARYPLPNTTRTETATPQVVCRICIIPTAGRALEPGALILWPAWELVVLAVGVLLARRRRREVQWRALGFLLITTVGFAVFHLSTAILGDGYAELGKHVFPAVVDTWMVTALVALGLVGLLTRRRDGPPPDVG